MPEIENPFPLPTEKSPTSAWVITPSSLKKPISFPEIFHNENPVEVEIGIGSGFFLTRYGKDNPDINILGVDKESSEVMRSADKARRMRLWNIRTLRFEARFLLEDYIPEKSLQNLHVYYSDPWPKTRHRFRRLWQPEFIKAAHRVISPGGKLFMKTDVADYFKEINRNIHNTKLFDLELDHRLDLDPVENDYETNFQLKARDKGHPLHYQIWSTRNP